jgi:hypothetical protein
MTEMETYSVNMISILEEFVEFDKSYLKSFKDNFDKVRELMGPRDLTITGKVIQMLEELTEIGIRYLNFVFTPSNC